MKRLLFLIGCLIATAPLLYAAGERVKEVKVTGEYAIVISNSDISPNEAKRRARDNARQQALEKVCPTRMTVVDKIEVSQAGESFNSLALRETSGEIVDFTVLREWWEQSAIRHEETIYYCEAKVKVKQSAPADPSFAAEVNGIRASYHDGDHLAFDILPTQECYLNIFIVGSNADAYLLYPRYAAKNITLRSGQLKAGQHYRFPDYVAPAVFPVEKIAGVQVEVNKVVFVFTKREWSFTDRSGSAEAMSQWIAKIPNDEKYVYGSVFSIVDK